MNDRQIANLAIACYEIQRAHNEIVPIDSNSRIFDSSIKTNVEWDDLPFHEQNDMVIKVMEAMNDLETKPVLKDYLFKAIVLATVRMNKR